MPSFLFLIDSISMAVLSCVLCSCISHGLRPRFNSHIGRSKVYSLTAMCSVKSFLEQNTEPLLYKSKGPILHWAQLPLYTDACIIPILHPRHSGLFPPQTHVGKLGNVFALPGAVQQKEEACSGANVIWCYYAVSENNSASDQEKPGLKSVALV